MSIKNYGEKSLIKIINAVVNGKELPKFEDYTAIFQAAKRHSLGNFFYFAIKDSEHVLSVDKKLAQQHFAALAAQQVSQDYYTDEIIKRFYRENIRFMPLKGYYVKNFYPIKEMRSSCDVDIFYDYKRKKDVRRILEDLGFKFISENLSDELYCKDKISFEMHFSLASDREYYKQYYKDAFSMLNSVDGVKYEFSDDDFYVYFIVHAAKHFTGGGFGIRTVLDIYFCLKNLNLNREYLSKELIKLGLDKFENAFALLANAWFGQGVLDGDTEILGEFVMDNATYGKFGNRSLLMSAEKSKSLKRTKFKFVLRSVFPPFAVMKSRFKILDKAPFLLPFVYVYRWIRTLFCRRDLIKKTVDNVNDMDESKIKKFARIREITGF